jgi:polyisoprenoid-binding protein YceI
MTEYTGSWVLDPAGTTVTIAAKTFWGLSTVRGAFGTVTGQGTVAEGGTASGTVTIDASSVDTGNAQRDKHLKSDDFFSVAENPTISVIVASATRKGNTLKAAGTLEAGGHSQPVTFDAVITEATDSAVTLSTQLPVNYRELGMTWNRMGMLGPVATATVSARFTKA